MGDERVIGMGLLQPVAILAAFAVDGRSRAKQNGKRERDKKEVHGRPVVVGGMVVAAEHLRTQTA